MRAVEQYGFALILALLLIASSNRSEFCKPFIHRFRALTEDQGRGCLRYRLGELCAYHLNVCRVQGRLRGRHYGRHGRRIMGLRGSNLPMWMTHSAGAAGAAHQSEWFGPRPSRDVLARSLTERYPRLISRPLPLQLVQSWCPSGALHAL